MLLAVILAATLQVAEVDLRIYDDPWRMNPPEYDERTLAHPFNPGPKIIFADPPAIIYEHKRLNLPDPVCVAGCDGKPRILPHK